MKLSALDGEHVLEPLGELESTSGVCIGESEPVRVANGEAVSDGRRGEGEEEVLAVFRVTSEGDPLLLRLKKEEVLVTDGDADVVANCVLETLSEPCDDTVFE